MIQIVIDSRGGDIFGQVGQELDIEVSKLERIIRVGVPNSHKRVRESCPHCPKDIVKHRK